MGNSLYIAIGETHYLVTTFSVWESAEHMQAFAYTSVAHMSVIQTAREQNWLAEELFARFKPVASFGSLNGLNPLATLRYHRKLYIDAQSRTPSCLLNYATSYHLS